MTTNLWFALTTVLSRYFSLTLSTLDNEKYKRVSEKLEGKKGKKRESRGTASSTAVAQRRERQQPRLFEIRSAGRGIHGRRETEVSSTHFFLAQLAHGDPFIPSVPLNVSSASALRTRTLVAAAVRARKGDAPRVDSVVAEMCQKFRQSLHICLRLDVSTAVSRRVTADRAAARLGCVVDSSKQLSNQQASARALFVPLLPPVVYLLPSFTLLSGACPSLFPVASLFLSFKIDL